MRSRDMSSSDMPLSSFIDPQIASRYEKEVTRAAFIWSKPGKSDRYRGQDNSPA